MSLGGERYGVFVYLIEGRGGYVPPNPGMGTIPPIRLDSPFHASSRINSLHTLRRNGSVVIHARAWLAATWLESGWLNLRSATSRRIATGSGGWGSCYTQWTIYTLECRRMQRLVLAM